FEVDFGRVYLNSKRLVASCLGYKVRHKSMLKGGRCHQNCELNNTKVVSGIRHIQDHIIKLHQIDPNTGLLPETPSQPQFSSPFAAAKAAGTTTVISHSP
ncbi:hypothetical protein EJ02DRAFT_295549, partial [Clathrospora elynae]